VIENQPLSRAERVVATSRSTAGVTGPPTGARRRRCAPVATVDHGVFHPETRSGNCAPLPA
jgi:hypothetical protein